MYPRISGTNKDVKSFLEDLPVTPGGETFHDFVRSLKDSPTLVETVEGLYNIKIKLGGE
jgi:hypothetical protein